jgi:hypothetical protein
MALLIVSVLIFDENQSPMGVPSNVEISQSFYNDQVYSSSRFFLEAIKSYGEMKSRKCCTSTSFQNGMEEMETMIRR